MWNQDLKGYKRNLEIDTELMEQKWAIYHRKERWAHREYMRQVGKKFKPSESF